MKTIIELAREAGFTELEFYGNKLGTNPTECFERFAALVRADEREAILAIEASSAFNRMYGEFCPKAKDLADAIRARGNT